MPTRPLCTLLFFSKKFVFEFFAKLDEYPLFLGSGRRPIEASCQLWRIPVYRSAYDEETLPGFGRRPGCAELPRLGSGMRDLAPLTPPYDAPLFPLSSIVPGPLVFAIQPPLSGSSSRSELLLYFSGRPDGGLILLLVD